MIVPHYEMHDLLPRAIRSVADQEYENIELIIVDDGSDEPPVLPQLQNDNINIKLYRIAHSGKPTAVNCGIRESEGYYLTILDADDQLTKDSLIKRVSVLENSGADLCIGSFTVTYDGNIRIERSICEFADSSTANIINAFLTRIITPFHQNTMLFSRQLLKRAGMMNPVMLRGQDKDFGVRLLKESNKIELIVESVYIYHRYNRPIVNRLRNRYKGMKYKLSLIYSHFAGWRGLFYVSWVFAVELAKFAHDIFGVYKR